MFGASHELGPRPVRAFPDLFDVPLEKAVGSEMAAGHNRPEAGSSPKKEPRGSKRQAGKATRRLSSWQVTK